ncbi:MAG: hypothetical protein PHY10_01435, partial [Patescibacteria group bacterium]|nr:hypothetical protein [Patescibacteria group bacterium]
KISFIISSLGLIGALLAYLILGGAFLGSILRPVLGGANLIYVLLFFTAGAALIFARVRNIARFELIMFVAFVIILFIFIYHGFPHVDYQNLLGFNPKLITFPYGIILFSLWGIALVPEIKEIVERNRPCLRGVIAAGVIVSALCYLFFVFIFLGVSGQTTTPDAMTGFINTLGNGVRTLGFVFGLITTFTSFIALGMTLKKIFWLDFHLPRNASWALACFIPLGLYFCGFKNFIDIIGLTGALMLGLEAIMVVFIYKNFLQKRFHQNAPWWLYLLVVLFVIGIVLQFIYFFTS